MRKLLTVLGVVVFLFASETKPRAFNPIGITTHTGATATDQTGSTFSSLLSNSANYTAHDTLVVPWVYYLNGSAAVTVTANDGPTTGTGNGNTWDCSTITQISTSGTVFGSQAGICYAYNITGSLTSDLVKLSFSSAVPYITLQVVELLPTNTTNPLDTASIVATNNTGTVGSITSGTFSTAHAVSITLCNLTAGNSQTWSVGNIGASQATLIQSVATSNEGSEYQTFSSTQSSITASASIGGTTQLAIVCASFWDGSGGAGGASVPKLACELLGVGCHL